MQIIHIYSTNWSMIQRCISFIAFISHIGANQRLLSEQPPDVDKSYSTVHKPFPQAYHSFICFYQIPHNTDNPINQQGGKKACCNGSNKVNELKYLTMDKCNITIQYKPNAYSKLFYCSGQRENRSIYTGLICSYGMDVRSSILHLKVLK